MVLSSWPGKHGAMLWQAATKTHFPAGLASTMRCSGRQHARLASTTFTGVAIHSGTELTMPRSHAALDLCLSLPSSLHSLCTMQRGPSQAWCSSRIDSEGRIFA